MAETKRTILIVDDEAAQRKLLGDFVESLGFCTEQASTGEEALEAISERPPDMVLLDVRLPGISGIEALPKIREIAGNLPVALITAHADLRQGVAAVKGGADDYLAKPLDLDELEAAIVDAIGAPDAAQSRATETVPELPAGIIADSPAMRHLVKTIAVVAPSDAAVLILGPSGAGKEVLAQLIHGWSPRAKRPMIVANCAGMPESLIESELFGHVKGAFTGATENRNGLIRAADGGTLFLDEIGELPLHLQPKLLRALETGQVTPVGSDKPVTVDARLVAATNRDLQDAVTEGQFREDLYYRINVVELLVPPLAERSQDILELARKFAAEFVGGPIRLSPQAVRCLLSHTWPGNVRELRNAIQLACLVCRGDVIMPEHLPPKIADHVPDSDRQDPKAGQLLQIERAAILATLEECNGNRTQAAKKLGISRRGLIYKLRAIEAETE
ncbi:MAG: sigma-54-dependent Fis family transcriptional regulator [Planctomycetes bacterium]|nr:sigma-54-dependent Fis family transcriptional regulator [Planctomycetota bacterium]